MSSDGTPETDVQLAARLATEAGHMLLALRERMFDDEAEPWQIKDAGDAVSQTFLADELERTRPDDAVLSEEGLEDPRRFDADRVWIVDPLDGTREFSERGRVDWAVHVAFVGSRPLRGRRGLAAGAGDDALPPIHRRCCPTSTASTRGSSRRVPAHRAWPQSWPTPCKLNRWRSGRPGPRPWRS